jgi:hypothetical protein
MCIGNAMQFHGAYSTLSLVNGGISVSVHDAVAVCFSIFQSQADAEAGVHKTNSTCHIREVTKNNNSIRIQNLPQIHAR